ncbi:AMP deaminase putative / myoadenylate deaminase putative [Euphorbia peplus]|nr:AMP deaminase putative / myoadenylate deaminase putative [Euphorbia peplus]
MSPIASASAFVSIEGSDEEDNMTDISKLDTTYLHTNETVVVGLDLVGDKSKPKRHLTKHMSTPAQWTNVFNHAFFIFFLLLLCQPLHIKQDSLGHSTSQISNF